MNSIRVAIVGYSHITQLAGIGIACLIKGDMLQWSSQNENLPREMRGLTEPLECTIQVGIVIRASRMTRTP